MTRAEIIIVGSTCRNDIGTSSICTRKAIEYPPDDPRTTTHNHISVVVRFVLVVVTLV